jgi:hypothetical protein
MEIYIRKYKYALPLVYRKEMFLRGGGFFPENSHHTHPPH